MKELCTHGDRIVERLRQRPLLSCEALIEQFKEDGHQLTLMSCTLTVLLLKQNRGVYWNRGAYLYRGTHCNEDAFSTGALIRIGAIIIKDKFGAYKG